MLIIMRAAYYVDHAESFCTVYWLRWGVEDILAELCLDTSDGSADWLISVLVPGKPSTFQGKEEVDNYVTFLALSCHDAPVDIQWFNAWHDKDYALSIADHLDVVEDFGLDAENDA